MNDELAARRRTHKDRTPEELTERLTMHLTPTQREFIATKAHAAGNASLAAIIRALINQAMEAK